MRRLAIIVVLLTTPLVAGAGVGNRLAYLDDVANPYYVNRDTARLVTPQWVGESQVEAVFVLAIDDMSDTAKYEAFLRPILNRLKEVQGHAGMSIMTKEVRPDDPQLQRWLREGVHIETHTITHPCPCLQKGSLSSAVDTYNRCVDLLSTIPGMRPVAFRMPCCDSMNSVSPRFFAEIFNRSTPAGNFLTIDTSVFQLFSRSDPALPRNEVVDEEGRARFRKYIPEDRLMVNYVENYPYPYVIGRLCWEFPCLMPSDWDAQHLNGVCSPTTIRDLQTAIDATVAKQGVFSLCFHPHGWIRNDQVVALINYARKRYGTRVRFLSFRDVEQRLNKFLLRGQPLRTPQGRDNGVRLLDVNHDGFMDVVVANTKVQQTRIWQPESGSWKAAGFPFVLIPPGTSDTTTPAPVGRFGVIDSSGHAAVLAATDSARGVWRYRDGQWERQRTDLHELDTARRFATTAAGRDAGVRLRDIDGDGKCELLIANPKRRAVFAFADGRWNKLRFAMPEGVTFVDQRGRDAGLRLVDLDSDGDDDLVFSNAHRYSVRAFTSRATGWSQAVREGLRNSAAPDAHREIPMIVRSDGSNNGVWFSFGRMWAQNEDTGATREYHVDFVDFADLLTPIQN